MKRKFIQIIAFFVLALFSISAFAQDYTFEDFVGTWHGTILSPSTGGATVPMSMTIESNGFYTETSGYLMPSLYPDTQECEYDAPTNRMHWWYLGTAWGGQYFYDHFYYEVVYFQNDTLEMHYNYWNDPVPFPEVGTIFLVKENLTPPPTALQADVNNNEVSLTWNVPVYGNGGTAYPNNYNIYYSIGEGNFELLETTTNTNFLHENMTAAGMHGYYVTAIFNEGESSPSNHVNIDLTTPPPTNLEGQLLGNNVALNWNQPVNEEQPMAGLLGYHIYHKHDNEEFELLMFVENNFYTHEDLPAGLHYYYTTAVYDGAESDPSNEVMVELIVSSISDELEVSTKLYPNPVMDVLNISSKYVMDAIVIYDQTGKVRLSQLVNGKNQKIDLVSLPEGFYLIQILSDEKIITKRLIVK